ncbi:MAG: helix-turn-helix domain-containing protein [Pseudomonadota bacterium]
MVLQIERFAIQSPSNWPPSGAQPLTFSAGEHLFHEGDDATCLYEIKDGVVVLYSTALDGVRQLLGVRFRGDLLGISGGAQHHCGALAARTTRVNRMSRAQVDRMIDADPKLARRLLKACGSELLRTREQLTIVGSRSALGRVAALLLDLAGRDGNGNASVTLPLSRSEMGDYLGLTLETVSRCMSRLKALNIIALPRSDTVVILNHSRLSDLASGIDEGAARGRMVA